MIRAGGRDDVDLGTCANPGCAVGGGHCSGVATMLLQNINLAREERHHAENWHVSSMSVAYAKHAIFEVAVSYIHISLFGFKMNTAFKFKFFFRFVFGYNLLLA